MKSVLYNDLINVKFERLLSRRKTRADGARPARVVLKARYTNWIPSINGDWDVWLSAGMTPKMFVIPNSESVSVICRRNAVEHHQP